MLQNRLPLLFFLSSLYANAAIKTMGPLEDLVVFASSCRVAEHGFDSIDFQKKKFSFEDVQAISKAVNFRFAFKNGKVVKILPRKDDEHSFLDAISAQNFSDPVLASAQNFSCEEMFFIWAISLTFYSQDLKVCFSNSFLEAVLKIFNEDAFRLMFLHVSGENYNAWLERVNAPGLIVDIENQNKQKGLSFWSRFCSALGYSSDHNPDIKPIINSRSGAHHKRF